ncbi:MAG TPA: DUF4625 domain-containing protein [Prevotella sp.]
MNKTVIYGAFAALLSVFTLSSLTSCSNDDDNSQSAKLEIAKTELGKENKKEAIVGSDLHVECEIVAEAKIKGIKVSLKQKDGKVVLEKDFGSNKSYVGVMNANFHEHLNLGHELAAGVYDFTMTVTDGNGQVKTWNEKLTLTAADANAPKIEITTPNAQNMTAAAGSKYTVEAVVTVTSAVKEIELEFHGKKEFPIEVADYNGKTGKINFKKEITVPADAEPGDYHLHFTVVDENGKKTTTGFKVFKITAKQ